MLKYTHASHRHTLPANSGPAPCCRALDGFTGPRSHARIRVELLQIRAETVRSRLSNTGMSYNNPMLLKAYLLLSTPRSVKSAIIAMQPETHEAHGHHTGDAKDMSNKAENPVHFSPADR